MESDHPTLSVEGDFAGDDDGKSYLFMKRMISLMNVSGAEGIV